MVAVKPACVAERGILRSENSAATQHHKSWENSGDPQSLEALRRIYPLGAPTPAASTALGGAGETGGNFSVSRIIRHSSNKTFERPELSIGAGAGRRLRLPVTMTAKRKGTKRPVRAISGAHIAQLTGTHEQTINTALGEVLHQLGRRWTLRSEHVGQIFEEGGRPDILVEKSDGWPIVIEAEVANHRQAEIEARSRLGNRLISTGHRFMLRLHWSIPIV